MSPGTRKVAVVLLNFTNNRTQPWTASQVRGVVFDGADSANNFYREASGGAVGLSGDVFGWYAINADSTSCNVATWRTAATAAATAAGVNLTGYQHVVYAWPYTGACPWAGMAGMPGTMTFINGSMKAGTVGHELGHNLGMDHAQALSCTSGGTRVSLSDSCTTQEYGDPFSTMGGGYNMMAASWHLAELGWLPGVQPVTASGTYSIAPLGSSGSPRLLRIARPNGTFLNLEFRQPKEPFQHYTLTYPVTTGVTIRLAPDPYGSTIAPTKLVDTAPSTTSFWDSPLVEGKTFADTIGAGVSKVQITTLSVSSVGATVKITFPSGSPTTTTTAPATTTTTKPPTTTTTAPPPTTVPPTTTSPPPTTAPPAPPGVIGSAGFVRVVANGSKSQSGNTSLTLVVPPGGGTAAGHRVVVAASVGTFGGTVGCADSRGNSYAVDGRVSTNNLFVCSAHVAHALQAGDTITVTYPGFSGVSMAAAYDFAGIAAASPVDGIFRTGASTSTKAVTVNPVLTTTNANDVLFAAVGSNGSFVPSAGFVDAGTFGGLAGATQTVSTTGAFGALGSVATGSWRALLIAYRAGS